MLDSCYTDFLSSSAKSEYIIRATAQIKSLDSYFKTLADEISSRTNQPSGLFLVSDFTNNRNAPWNKSEDKPHMCGVYLEISNLFEEIGYLFENFKEISELNLVKVTDKKVFDDYLLFLEFKLDNNEIVVQQLQPITKKGIEILTDVRNRFEDDLNFDVYEDDYMLLVLKEFGVSKFDKN